VNRLGAVRLVRIAPDAFPWDQGDLARSRGRKPPALSP